MTLKKEQYECFLSLKLAETDSADTHQNIESHRQRRSLSPRSSPPPPPPPPCTPSNALSVHKHKLNLLLMIALLTRRGSIHSRRPATTTGQISWREGRRDTAREGGDGEAVGEDRSYIYSGLNNGELGGVSIPSTLQPKYRKKSSI